MSSLYSTSEIVELKDEPNHQARAYDKDKRPQGCSKFLEDDINKLFEGINVRTSFNGDETGGATPRKNPSKKPMRMSLSSSTGIGYSEPMSIKQALRGLCISQASEMAAIKRLSKPPGSPALSDSGKLANLYKSVVKAENKDPEFEISLMAEESTSNSSRKMPMYPNEPKMKSYNNSAQSSPRLNLEKSIKIMGNEPKMKSYNNSTQSSPRLNLEKSTKIMGSAPRLNEILREPEHGNISRHDAIQEKKIISNSNLSQPCNKASEDSLKSVESNSEVKNLTPSKVVNKSATKLRRKGKLQSLPPSSSSINGSKSGKSTRTTRTVKTVIRNKNLVKKKSKQDLTSASAISTASTAMDAKSVPESSQLICQRCHCSLKDPQMESIKEQDSTGKNGPMAKNNKSSKCGDKGEFTQSSNSSVGEYSSSTSISEESNLRDCIIGNRPHMSKDRRWQAIHHMMKQNGFLGLRHFNLLKKLGCGDIGTVYLAELIGTNCPFAIKVMDNEFLERRKKMPRAHTERDILRTLDHPFLPTLYAHFVSENLSCLVMEYCPGGDLHVLRQKQPGRFFHEQAARFYVAEVLLALEYLHMLGIVYRDLKPENILVREDGHIMLTDFDLSLRCSVSPTLLQSPSSGTMDPARISGPCAGSSCIDPFCIKPTCQVSCFSPRILPGHKKSKVDLSTLQRSWPQLVAEPTEARSNSFVGTHEYLAPEIIKGDGHGSAVDWWTFGIFLFELLYGKTPFKGSGNDETLANVVLDTLKFPETPLVSFQARDLIKGLLAKEPENRLGSQRGAAEIKQHPFFDGLNWALIRCAVPPELPEPYDISVSKSTSLEKAKKYLDYNGGSGGSLEFELF